MKMQDMIEHYKQHTVVTNPGKYSEIFKGLNLSVKETVNLVGGISAHYQRDLTHTDIVLSKERLKEVDTRFVENIIERVFELNQQPLTETRPMHERFMGTCRDGAVLVCSMLRSMGIAARMRYGFIHIYLDPKKPIAEHLLIEYWHPEKQQWMFCEPRMNQELMDRNGITGIESDNFPLEHFIFATDAWQEVRKNRRSAVKYSDLTFKESYGLWKIRNIMMYDMASLIGFEPLVWDIWGYMIRAKRGMEPKSFFQLHLLDKLARLDLFDPEQWAEYMRLSQRKKDLKLPKQIKSCSPENGDYFVDMSKMNLEKQRAVS
ncbi:transglutaminase domain-containing protein [Marinicella sp. W31]|uniref:transglutaminase domain-containing protein n=1 Tax=Marinicella sp. W31 TaxID=3023713 RepID=UPI00375747EA